MKKILLVLLAASVLFSASGCKKKKKTDPSATPEVTATATAEAEAAKKEAEVTAEPEKTEEAEKETKTKDKEKKETKKTETKKEEKAEEEPTADDLPEFYTSSDYVPPQPDMETETTADIAIETVPVTGTDTMTETTDNTAIIVGQEGTKETDEAGVTDALKRAEEAARIESENW